MKRTLCVLIAVFVAMAHGGYSSAPLTCAYYATNSTCPKYCSNDYTPVCATDGTSYLRFANLCQLQRYNCRTTGGNTLTVIADMTLCNTFQAGFCIRTCNSIGPRVCATDGITQTTYTNLCQMLYQACIRNINLSFLNYGNCNCESQSNKKNDKNDKYDSYNKNNKNKYNSKY